MPLVGGGLDHEMMTFQNIDPKDYLLGKLEESDAEAVEKDYFRNAASFNELLMAESELYDEYALNTLAADDRARFENRLLITGKQHQRKGFADALIRYVSDGAPAKAVPAAVTSGWLQTVKEFFSSHRLVSAMAVSAAALLLAVGAFWFASLERSTTDTDVAHSTASTEPTGPTTPVPDLSPGSVESNVIAKTSEVEPPRSKEAPAQRQVPPATPSRKSNPVAAIVSTIILSPGSVRDDSGGKVFVVPGTSSAIELRLEFEPLGHNSYFAVVETADGQQIWSGNVRHKGDVAFARFPSRRIKTGDYIVALKGLGPTRTYDTVAEYSFTIERK